MRIKTALISSVCLAVAAFAVAGGDEDAIRAAHDNFSKAALANNFAAMEKSIKEGMTADFKYKSAQGQVETRDQWLKHMKQEFASGMKIKVFKFNVGKIAIKGNTAKVQSTLTIVGSGPGPDKKNHTFEGVSTSEESWVKVGSKWKVKAINTKREKMKMDGKPFDPSKMGGG